MRDETIDLVVDSSKNYSLVVKNHAIVVNEDNNLIENFPTT